jgi:S1-C subfamily serine protease
VVTATNGVGDSFTVSRLLNVDEANDLVTMQLEGEGKAIRFVPLQPADSRKVTVGLRVLTISTPRGLSQTVADGLLSAIRSEDGLQLLQITAPISPGSSGGPVLNTDGEIVGVIRGQITSGQQLNFAIPIDIAVRLLNESTRRAPSSVEAIS